MTPGSGAPIAWSIVEVIDSIKDPRIAAARALATRAGRIAVGRCLIEGAGLIRQVVAAGGAVEFVLRAVEADDAAVGAELTAAGVTVYAAREGLLRKVVGGAKPVGWLAVAHLPDEVLADAPYGDFAVVCEQVNDPGNLGTIARTARALGVRDIVLTDTATDLTTRRVLDAARGAVLGCRVRRFDTPADALKALRAAGFQIVATSPRGSRLQSTAPLRGDRIALVIGNETDGVSAETQTAADLLVQIPMAGAVESLNVGVATGISIYELRMRMILTVLTDRIRNTLGRNLGAAATLVRTAFDAQLRQVGDLNSDQAILLMILACDRITTRDQLRRDIGTGTTELDTMLAPLADNGYLTADQRSVTITTEGERAVAALWTIQERAEEAIYRGFTAAERDQLADMLRRIQHNAGHLNS
ncbi:MULTISPECIES: TrmH family RNA methyltransferase [unclassified Nocardia]|uniref:TrmH family RNA methyltransferase n=1 Tax=unclassified Nocardia TaxID=2637762 RepID=UPI001CE3E785|nr:MULTISPECIES: TrmH family RNA methyltransferase [unclassified Nocardia]